MYLSNKRHKIPKDSLFFDKKYRSDFYCGLPELVDKNAIYKFEYTYYNEYNSDTIYGKNQPHRLSYYIFNESGAVSKFFKEEQEFNPNKSGYRGISFKNNNDWEIHMVGPISDSYEYGIIRYKFIEIQSDTIKLKRIGMNHETMYVYSKDKTKDKPKSFKFNW